MQGIDSTYPIYTSLARPASNFRLIPMPCDSRAPCRNDAAAEAMLVLSDFSTLIASRGCTMHLCDQSGEAARSAGPCGSHILTCRPGWEWTVTHALPTALTRSARTLPSEELFPPDLRRIREDSHAQVGLKTAYQTELPVARGRAANPFPSAGTGTSV